MNQNDMLLEYIKEHGSVTSYDAFRELGITRLSARIHDLRTSGNQIYSVRESGKNRFGEKVSYERYFIKEV